VGYDNVIGYLKGGIEAWKNSGKSTDSIRSISAAELEIKILAEPDLNVIDVRNVGEYLSEHVLNAENCPLAELNDSSKKLDQNDTYFIHCAGGYRSMVAASLLRMKGFKNIIDIAGGYKAIKESKIPKTEYICPSKIKV